MKNIIKKRAFKYMTKINFGYVKIEKNKLDKFQLKNIHLNRIQSNFIIINN